MKGNDGRVHEELLPANLAVVNHGLGGVAPGGPGLLGLDPVRARQVQEERPPHAALVVAAGDVAVEDAAAAAAAVAFRNALLGSWNSPRRHCAR